MKKKRQKSLMRKDIYATCGYMRTQYVHSLDEKMSPNKLSNTRVSGCIFCSCKDLNRQIMYFCCFSIGCHNVALLKQVTITSWQALIETFIPVVFQLKSCTV